MTHRRHGRALSSNRPAPRLAGGWRLARALLLSVLLPALAHADPQAEGELNRAKAALQLRKLDEAARRFDKLARAGHPVAQFYMGRLTAMGQGVPRDMAGANVWFERSARQGHAEAQAVLGLNYMQGLGVAADYAEAARWSKLAADQGHGGAAYNLASMYSRGGPGLAADRALAERWARVAMAKGFPDALKARPAQAEPTAEAAALFREGQRLYRAGDMAGAARVFARCAAMGDAKCQLQIGWHHEEGKGVERNLATAVKWYQAAAEQNDPVAAENLGNMHQLGRGTRKNCRTAVEWYARAAMQNHHPALYSLGRMYQFGFGVKEDRAKSHAFYRQAAALGNPKAREALATFGRFSWPDPRSAAIYDERVTRYMSAINACQARADQAGHTVTCLVPVIDWNPKTWEDC
jgi:TPR repeat protein